MKPRRIQMRRTKGWRKPENTVYVGRPTKWGNPFAVGKTVKSGPLWHGQLIDTPEYSVKLFLEMLDLPKRNYPSIDEIKSVLRGKNLACWCRPGAPCHADVLLDLANRED